MENDEMIPAKEFCTYHNIEYSFIHSLEDSGLITVSSHEESIFIPVAEMPKLEKFIRLHYDLDINLEGLETIQYLLDKIEFLQKKLKCIQNNSGEF